MTRARTTVGTAGTTMTDGTGAVAATTIIVVIMTAGTTIGTGIGGTGTGMSAVTMTGGTRRH
ncbi:hypothetical protein FA13DRAFT_1731633 [Coprinellus micaceus]|uniref:Uncharacterized protein n=1 Tax=Coprinellus micaceus TaxID=71717 RepID=A0A4Y7TE26_COPMI|nr:hypothetical protein FA13DRAFT_1731633 [Coprinellus micaceus]